MKIPQTTDGNKYKKIQNIKLRIGAQMENTFHTTTSETAV